MDTASFENPLWEDENVFKFETNNKTYKKLVEEKEKIVSIKDYIHEDEYIDQIKKFTRDR